VLVKLLHSKTASKAGTSLWIPAVLRCTAKKGKNQFGKSKRRVFLNTRRSNNT
jgi:hypothetical protein